jgi:hypothetical protein
MSAQPQFECRVLAGLHQGASALLSPTSDTHSVGPTSDADIVLRDLPVTSAQVRVDGQSWSWSDPEGSLTLALGEALDLGGVTLQICRAGAAWPASPALARVQRRPSAANLNAAGPDPVSDEAASEETDASPEHDTDHTTGDTTDAAATADTLLDATAAPAVRNRQRRLKQMLVITGLALLACLPLAGAWMASAPSGEDTATTPPPVAEPLAEPVPAVATEAELTAIEALIVKKGLEDRLEASLNTDTGRIEITGVVADDDVLEHFVRALRKAAVRVTLRLLTQADFANEVSALQDDLPEGVKIGAKPIGTVILEGTVENDAERESLVVQVENALPMAAEIYVDLKTRADIAMEKRRQQKAVAVVADPPFPKLLAVVSGPEPFLVMPNGDRVMVGGMVNGFTVMAISDKHIDYQYENGKLLRAAR